MCLSAKVFNAPYGLVSYRERGSLMPDDIMKIIGALKADTVGRCRERINLASCKAKEIIGRKDSARPAGKGTGDNDNQGITGVLRRRHGL